MSRYASGRIRIRNKGYHRFMHSVSASNRNMNIATGLDQEKELYPNFSFTVLTAKETACAEHAVSSSAVNLTSGSTKPATSTLQKARLGLLVTPSGSVQTPNFVFCATKAAAKALTMEQVRQCGTQLVLSNTYHLMLTPGSDIVQSMGGLQKFTGWKGPMLTDSGGYQIFSMGYGSVSDEIKGKRLTKQGGAAGASAHSIAQASNANNANKAAVAETTIPLSSLPHQSQSLVSITEHGATFRSYIDGLLYELTPERSMHVQKGLGADLVVVLDECTPFNVSKEYTQRSMERSHRWALRCLEEFQKTNMSGQQALYGIVQGGIYTDLRLESTKFCNTEPFFGIAIGGSLGESKAGMHDIVKKTRAMLRDDKPIHLLGIGGIRDIFLVSVWGAWWTRVCRVVAKCICVCVEVYVECSFVDVLSLRKFGIT